jgi:hypothetical protein
MWFRSPNGTASDPRQPIRVSYELQPPLPCNQGDRFTEDLAFAGDVAVAIHNAHA